MTAFFPWLDWTQAAAPNTLNQPILPGWSFLTVNEANSSAPDTEKRIVAQDSYGRQIGRLMDVVDILVREAEKTSPDLSGDKCVMALDDLKARVDEAKAEAQKLRQDRLIEDLLALKRSNAVQFTAIMKAVGTV
ncbi:hypothetical protein ABAC460_02320 [Asticcacaulis sp. AC460]|uniref:hypothetical protein n=1 Tax=Asticcacaulis sp. AC460 TaxID=1282360 RepID=UPI0003C40E3E|nr:hypothetical protein [Asticcacaulis sp. AC460]ESQ93114.1 hypothetical protein ABAC460_02320 [Asticcacaulis sp. AC460]